MELKNALQDLGLTQNESVIYLALLERGLTQAGPLIATSKLHRVLVYTALERLESMGLVSTSKRKNIKLFQPTDPETLIDNTRRAGALAEALVPKLRALSTEQADVVTVRTLIGEDGFVKNLEETVMSAAHQKPNEICIIGGAGSKKSDPFELTGARYPSYVALSQKYNVHKRLLCLKKHASLFTEKYLIYPNNEMRVLSEGLSSPSLTRITSEMVTIEIYQPTITVIQIRSAVVARNYLDSFELLWKAANKYSTLFKKGL